MSVNVITIPVGMMESNCYLFWDEETKKAAIVDPGDSPGKILNAVKAENVQVEYIILTHGHFDHIMAANNIKEAFCDARVLIHREDESAISSPGDSPVNKGLVRMTNPALKPDVVLEGGERFPLGGLTFEILHTPGHTRGCVCVLCTDALFTGDTLFQGDIGRTDFSGGSMDEMLDSLAKVLYPIQGDPAVYPGHGPASELEYEKKSNPYILSAIRR